tara:strand:- start:5742 stop:5942 length:201 start_codon:yes stop_codon:yes gene_type:complete
MNELKSVIFFIGVGLTIGFSLIVYAHANFSTKETTDRIEQYQKRGRDQVIKRLDRMNSKLDKLLSK